jgi:hypothetical protein
MTEPAAFDGETAETGHNAVLYRTVPPVRELNPASPAKLEEIIHKALEGDRELRCQAAAEMFAELRNALKTIQDVPPIGSVEASPPVDAVGTDADMKAVPAKSYPPPLPATPPEKRPSIPRSRSTETRR